MKKESTKKRLRSINLEVIFEDGGVLKTKQVSYTAEGDAEITEEHVDEAAEAFTIATGRKVSK